MLSYVTLIVAWSATINNYRERRKVFKLDRKALMIINLELRSSSRAK